MGKIGNIVYQEQTVDSTQTIATALANEGAAEGVVVSAEEQVAGKGRMGRKWHSKYGDSLAMSIILRPTVPLEKYPQLTLVAAVAVVQTIEKETGIRPDIKWPNDILINGKKLVGILTELHRDKNGNQFVVLGIGINVNTAQEDFPNEVQEIATSLRIELGEKVEKEKIMQGIFTSLESLYRQYLDESFTEIKKMWESYSISIGKEIVARTLTEVIFGKAVGITEEGVLLLEDKSGKIHSLYSADIELT